MLKIECFTGGIAATNAFLVYTNGDCLLVDAPEGVADWLRAADRSPDALLLTHLHFDHIMDAAEVQRSFGARVYSHSAPDPDLTLESLLQGFAGPEVSIEAFEPDVLLEGESSLHFGEGNEFELLHLPGHSPDSIGFHLPEEQVLFGGDVLFHRGIGRTDFPHGDHDQLLGSIREKIFPLDATTRVLSGHGPETTVGEERSGNPFL